MLVGCGRCSESVTEAELRCRLRLAQPETPPLQSGAPLPNKARADTDAMGTLTERTAHMSNAARTVLATKTEEKRAVLVPIFQPVQPVELLRVEHSITWRHCTKAKSNCS